MELVFYLCLFVIVLVVIASCSQEDEKYDRTFDVTQTVTNEMLHNIKDTGALSVECRKSAFKVCVAKSSEQYYLRLCYKSNGKTFMHSENYKNKKFAEKQASKLAEELNAEVIFSDERN